MNTLKTLSISASLMLAATAGTAHAQVTYLTAPTILSCNAMSANGRFIVGDTDLNFDSFPDGQYIYDTQTGELFTLPPGGVEAIAVSNDGTRVLGSVFGPDQDPILGVTAGIWTEAGGWVSLGSLPDAGDCPSRSNGYSMTPDGQTAVGLSWDGCSGRGFIWTQETGMQELQPLAAGGNRASVISPDGSVIAGFAQGNAGRTPARWDGNTLQGTLLGPGGADAQGEIYGISDDNSTLVGRVYFGSGPVLNAAKWVDGGEAEMIGQGALLPGWAGNATDIANDGTVVGFDNLLGNRRAWIKPADSDNIQLLADWANANGADIPEEVELLVARQISADGSTIIGFGFDGVSIFGFILQGPATAIPCPADVNGSGTIDLADLNTILAAFGNSDAGDTDNDGDTDLQDLNAVLANFGQACP